jgi:DnaJ family protein A protein 2
VVTNRTPLQAALSSHPDKVPEEEREEAEIKFKAVSQAYEILHDEDNRERYDRHGMAAFDPSHGGMGMDGEVDLEDLLSQMFMGGMGGMGGMPGMGGMGGGMPGGRSKRKQKGKDVQQDYEVSLEELYKGKTVKLASTRSKLCGSCSGYVSPLPSAPLTKSHPAKPKHSSGGKEGAKARKCATCQGRGWNQTLRQVGPGLMTQENAPCSACKATGEMFREKDRCRKCKGTCVVEEKKVLEIYIPRGSLEGDRIVLEGEADEQPGYETGNIVFILEEKEHEFFTRSGADLAAPLKIDLSEALTGFSRVVLKHLDGRGIKVTHPQGKILRPGQVLKVEGEGMPHKRGEGKGDLYLTVEIEFPGDDWTPDVDIIRKVLPYGTQAEVTGDPVDEVEYDDADLEDVSHSFSSFPSVHHD